jgi:hypothetical protein
MPLRRCRWFSFRQSPGPASNQPSAFAAAQPSRTQPSTLIVCLARRRCPWIRCLALALHPLLRPCLRSGLRPTLGTLPTTLIACPAPAALPSGLAHANPSALPRTGLQLASPPGPSELNLRLLIASAILRLPSLPWLRLAPLPWPFRFRLQDCLAALPPALPSGCASTPGLRPSLPLNPPAAFQPAFQLRTRAPHLSTAFQPAIWPAPSGTPAFAFAPSLSLPSGMPSVQPSSLSLRLASPADRFCVPPVRLAPSSRPCGISLPSGPLRFGLRLAPGFQPSGFGPPGSRLIRLAPSKPALRP